MNELIPTIEWDDLVKIVEAGKLRELKSCEVDIGGERRAIIVIYHGDVDADSYARIQSERIALKSNIVGGKEPSELLAELQPSTLYDKRVAAMANAREAKKAKREAEREAVGV